MNEKQRRPTGAAAGLPPLPPRRLFIEVEAGPKVVGTTEKIKAKKLAKARTAISKVATGKRKR